MKKIQFVLCFVLSSTFLYGQIDSTTVNLNPYGVIYNHLYYLQADSYNPERASISIPPEFENRAELAIKLKQVLDGKGMFVDLNRVPTDDNFIDSTTNETIYHIDKHEALIYLEKIDNSWYYSRTTLSELNRFHKKLYPFGTQFVTKLQSPFWQLKILGIKFWVYIGFILLLAVSWIIFVLGRLISQKLLKLFLKSRIAISEKTDKTLLQLSKLIAFLLSLRVILYFIPMFQLSPLCTSYWVKGLNILSIFFIILAFKNVVGIFFIHLDKLTKKTDNTLDDQLLPVLEKLSIIILWSIGIIYILDYLDVNVIALLAGLSIGGLALALAAQDTVKNFFGSVMIFLDRPFQIGDWIHFNNVDGTVEEVGVRSTRIRTFSNSITYVPNALLADSVIDNMGLRVYRRFKNEIAITYDTPPELIDIFVDGVREVIKRHPNTRSETYEVHLNSLGDSSINILMYMFFEAPNWTVELKAKHDILYAIIKLADHLGVKFAYPTQTIQLENINTEQSSSENQVTDNTGGKKSLDEILKEIESYYQSDKNPGDKLKPIGGE